MSDLFLDFRDFETRHATLAKAISLLRFCEATAVRVIEHELFMLILTRVDGFDLWGPCEKATPDGKLFVALAGRIAMDESGWEAARQLDGTGGLACKAILHRYQLDGLESAAELNGNFLVVIYDESRQQLHLITDRCGMFLGYYREPLSNARVVASHPDVLAAVLGEDQQFDRTSLAEFLTTGRLTFPYTYYRNLRALQTAYIHTVTFLKEEASSISSRRYFQPVFQIDTAVSVTDLATDLAKAFRQAVRRRTLPIFGQSGVGLSGGLDSRAILSSARSGTPIRALTLFDEENVEFQTARALAQAAGADFLPIRRDFEFYANAAELGVRISGATGNIASNHFLGIRAQLANSGIQNFLTGCYCDYLFKGLSLNTSETPFARRERRSDFNFEFYHPCYWDCTKQRAAVEARLAERFPESAKSRFTEDDWLTIELKRAFPLAYEGDLAQRIIPQRVMPWYLPVVDNDVIDVYLRIPSLYKLNASLFKQMVLLLCDEAVRRVPDSNTGAPLTARPARYAMHRYVSALGNRLKDRISPGIATRGSWPNWKYYVNHSRVILKLWQRKKPVAEDLLVELTGKNPLQQSPMQFADHDVQFFLRLLTLKLWLDQRGSDQD